jgi:hypothetical protein
VGPPAPDDFDDIDGIDPGPREPGQATFLDLDPASRLLLEDWGWVNDQFNAGRWAEFAGSYIAVYRKQFLGHGPDPIEFRARPARDHGVPPGKISISYVEPPIEC